MGEGTVSAHEPAHAQSNGGGKGATGGKSHRGRGRGRGDAGNADADVSAHATESAHAASGAGGGDDGKQAGGRGGDRSARAGSRSGGKGGKDGGKSNGGKGGSKGGKSSSQAVSNGDGDRCDGSSYGGRGGRGYGAANGYSNGQSAAGQASRGKGAARTKVGDTREMGGVSLVAVERDGRIAWEPVNGIDSAASREAQRRAEAEERKWAMEKQAAVKDARLAEAREIERREKQRKAQLLGAENVYRTQKARGPVVPVPRLLAETRLEEEAARRAGMPTSAPGQYKFIKESLDALELAHAAKEQAVRQAKYEQNRRRLQLGTYADADADAVADADADDNQAEEEDLRSRLAKMTDEEFKALAMARKERAQTELAEAAKQTKVAGKNGAGKAAMDGAAEVPEGANGKRPQSGRQRKPKPLLDPRDDPDYRR